jgi:hypothetical protein
MYYFCNQEKFHFKKWKKRLYRYGEMLMTQLRKKEKTRTSLPALERDSRRHRHCDLMASGRASIQIFRILSMFVE